MKKSNFSIFLVLVQFIVFSSFSNICIGQAITAPSVWENQSGSYLYIDQIKPDGQLVGHYINNDTHFHCVGTPYPLTGWVISGTNTITFTVKWDNSYANCQSLTSWTGFLNSEGSRITTLWQLVSNGTTSTRQIVQGSDTFVRVSSKSHASLAKKIVNKNIKKKEKN